jgi:hypothetical protein
MPNLTAKVAFAIFSSLLAGVSMAGVSSRSAHAEDSCLAAPKGVAPAGSHWHYRIDRATKQHCWYARDEKQARATPNTTAVTDTAQSEENAPSPAASVRKSVADAHAELQPAQPRANAVTGEPAASVNAGPATPAAAPQGAPDADASPSAVGARWLDPNNAASSDDSLQPADTSDAASPSNVAPDPAASSAPVTAAAPLATADASSVMGSNPLQSMLLIVVGALAFAGVAGSIIYRFGSAPARSYAMRDGRRDIWDTAFEEQPRRPVLPAAAHRPNIGIPRELRDLLQDEGHDANGPDDRIVRMLSQLARSAQT